MPEQVTPSLSGLKILDLSTLIAAPMASTLLADFGADVVKVELPSKGDALRDLAPHKEGEPLWWKVTNRNKRGITLDIRTPEGRDLLLRLLPQFDVLVENFRPGTLEKYGLDCASLHAVNPRLIILRVSGYGQTGPLAQLPGFARIAEAFSGFTYLCGEPERTPLHVGFPVADAVTGLFGALSILIACHRRGVVADAPGEVIDLSLYESMFRLLEFLPIEYDQLGVVRERSGTRSQYASPSNVYRSKDGKWISMSASAQSVFERLALTIGRPDIIADPRFATNPSRIENAEELDQIVGAWIAAHDFEEVMRLFAGNGVSGGPVNSIRDIFESKHAQARETIVYVDDEALGPVAMPNVVPKLANAPGAIRSTGPRHGEHTEVFFRDALGLSPGEISELHRKKVI
jgi:crotonobetainyl-CoA:carnitine CoA-transferase CaiB-like acyl-CoA transferase